MSAQPVLRFYEVSVAGWRHSGPKAFAWLTSGDVHFPGAHNVTVYQDVNGQMVPRDVPVMDVTVVDSNCSR